MRAYHVEVTQCIFMSEREASEDLGEKGSIFQHERKEKANPIYSDRPRTNVLHVIDSLIEYVVWWMSETTTTTRGSRRVDERETDGSEINVRDKFAVAISCFFGGVDDRAPDQLDRHTSERKAKRSPTISCTSIITRGHDRPFFLSNRIKINNFIGSIHSGGVRMHDQLGVSSAFSRVLLATAEQRRNQLDENPSDLN